MEELDPTLKHERGATILIADDEPEVVDLVRIILESEGYRVLDASNGLQALKQIQAHRPDLILMDMRMPEMTGLGVLNTLAQDPETRSIPVVMLSVVVTDPEIRMALSQGAVAYLSKPFEVRELLWMVDRVLGMDPEQRSSFRQQMIDSVGRRA